MLMGYYKLKMILEPYVTHDPSFVKSHIDVDGNRDWGDIPKI